MGLPLRTRIRRLLCRHKWYSLGTLRLGLLGEASERGLDYCGKCRKLRFTRPTPRG